jgi:hypothetical protein
VGSHFDPAIVRAFNGARAGVYRIGQEFRDAAA